MKFTIHHDPEKKALSIPYAALQHSGLNEAEELTLHAVGGCALVTRPELNATHAVETIHLLSELCKEVIVYLAKVTQGVAEKLPSDCDDCENKCGGLTIPACLLESAGIDKDTYLDFSVENGKITLFPGEKEKTTDPLKNYDENFLAMLSCAGVDMSALEVMMRVDAEVAQDA